MQAEYTIVAAGEDAAGAEFEQALAAAMNAEVEREEPGLSALQLAQDAWSFVVTNKEAISIGLDVAKAAAAAAGALIGLAAARKARSGKLEMTLVEGGRKIVVTATNRAELEKTMAGILGRARAGG